MPIKMKLRDGTPDEVGISTSHVVRIIERCEGWVREGIHPALVVLAAHKGVIFIHQAFGKLTPEVDSSLLPKDAIFPLASLTKPLTATLAMMLVEDGLLGLNRPVQEYIPEFEGKEKEKITVSQLLTHTSGINSDLIIPAVEQKQKTTAPLPERDENQHPSVHEVLHYGMDVPLGSAPGELMRYSGYGYVLLGEIIRRITQQDLDSFASKRLFQPLDLKNTWYSVPETARGRVVRRPADAPFAEIDTVESQENPIASAGAFSTAMDMAVFGQMFLNRGSYDGKKILSPMTVNAMTTNQLPGTRAVFLAEEFPEAGWGLGWSVNAKFKGEVYGEPMLSNSAYLHGGAGGVLQWVDPDRETVGVLLSIVTELHAEYRQQWTADLYMNMVASAIEI